MRQRPAIFEAAFWMTGAIVSFCSMAVAGRAVSLELDTFELMTFRSIIGLILVLIIGKFAGTLVQINNKSLGIHILRNVSHFAGQNMWFFAVTVIPLAQVFALEFTSPLWVTLFAPLLLGEKLTKMRVFAAIMGFVGIVIVARPDSVVINMGVIFAALSAVCFAGSALFTTLLTRNHTVTCILFWLTFMQLFFGLICAGYDGDFSMPSVVTLPWLFLIGCSGLLAHFCLTKALSIAPAIVVLPIDFIRLPFIAVIGALVYHETIAFSVYLGAVIIFAANYANIWYESRKMNV
ncbi:MAG: DMT family transporter [Paracoccaceae bacterium]|jgi:drug/metabolite transporter (DMT)-like permease